ncbi:hypothetical protein SDC9_109312 [bioreactor metagenome]|uniref:Uncharacterized protein n=1 Tax=bioreactor metagenome TaxID=1076179 RepID=A0A645BAD7_9ZZZZ
MCVQRRTVLFDFLHQAFNDDVIVFAQWRVIADIEMRIHAQIVQHAGQFDGDVARADDSDFLRQFSPFEERIGNVAEFCARNPRTDRFCAGRDQDMLGADQLPVHFNSMVVDEFGEAFDHIDIAAFEAGLIGVAGALNIGIPVLQ